MELKRVKALSKKCSVLAACNISKNGTLYLEVNKRDLAKAIKYLKSKSINHIRAHYTQDTLYIGE